jgi:hypothetical protein
MTLHGEAAGYGLANTSNVSTVLGATVPCASGGNVGKRATQCGGSKERSS